MAAELRSWRKVPLSDLGSRDHFPAGQQAVHVLLWFGSNEARLGTVTSCLGLASSRCFIGRMCFIYVTYAVARTAARLQEV
jgi:hypothetical protein